MKNDFPLYILRNDMVIDFNWLATVDRIQGEANEEYSSMPSLHHELIILDYRTTINFKNQRSLIKLTQATLKHIFGVKYWECPVQNLCPRVPNRLNYILWINQYVLEKTSRSPEIRVLDIGTGATLIYPLLGHKMFKWKFLATESNADSYQNACKIINSNDLADSIQCFNTPAQE